MEEQTIKEMVKDLMNSDIRCRNDDKWLIIMLWQKKQGKKIYIPFNEVENLACPSSIIRARRAIQNTDHALLPTTEIKKARNRKQNEMQERYSSF